jgi:hypothetical protein
MREIVRGASPEVGRKEQAAVHPPDQQAVASYRASVIARLEMYMPPSRCAVLDQGCYRSRRTARGSAILQACWCQSGSGPMPMIGNPAKLTVGVTLAGSNLITP